MWLWFSQLCPPPRRLRTEQTGLCLLDRQTTMQSLGKENHSSVSEFILLGFSSESQVRMVLFTFFLTLYFITILGNGLIITLSILLFVWRQPQSLVNSIPRMLFHP